MRAHAPDARSTRIDRGRRVDWRPFGLTARCLVGACLLVLSVSPGYAGGSDVFLKGRGAYLEHRYADAHEY
ncbi:MAG: hypothetical protein K0U93_08820, partial [Gammaproteobacteria bacterium]|nr:hypothetical protein [Gammaproteobacteria bacterium]